MPTTTSTKKGQASQSGAKPSPTTSKPSKKRKMDPNAQKYYAVRAGNIPGVYLTWTECQEQTAGFRGASYKSFTSREDAEAYVAGRKTSAAADTEDKFYAVAGWKAPKYKKFGTRGEAIEFIRAHGNEERQRSRSQSVSASPSGSYTNLAGMNSGSGATERPPSKAPGGVISSKEIDQDIQEAIRLHEEGDLERSTQLFGRLADPYGANNPLSQVLYGLALRHGWGCEPDVERAVTYLSAAASNAAAVETMALKAGVKKGGAAKGELVLAIFELANCFRHGWGIAKDPVAAKQFQAARYYRLAEKSGSKTLGNTWIWKEKYNPNYRDDHWGLSVMDIHIGLEKGENKHAETRDACYKVGSAEAVRDA
ncbi:hypothetical protein NUW58_g5834 [Xylaria curta]|uniref:Uncharacterized protein n=1 Tax=Xylaria curta TaxID=42375 RepID=A0ACC1P272_9PEZI|nr:hypothetical protein NUW58_g5834 [Xylaria curta]